MHQMVLRKILLFSSFCLVGLVSFFVEGKYQNRPKCFAFQEEELLQRVDEYTGAAFGILCCFMASSGMK
jgi:hypothetical protein